MRIVIALVALLFTASGYAAAQNHYTLKGDWQQGSVVIGQGRTGLKRGARRAQAQRSRPEGLFVFAFDRDAKGKAVLKITPPAGPADVVSHVIEARKWGRAADRRATA